MAKLLFFVNFAPVKGVLCSAHRTLTSRKHTEAESSDKLTNMRFYKIFTIVLTCLALTTQANASKLMVMGKQKPTAAKPMVIVDNNSKEADDEISGEIIVKTAMQYLGVPYRSGKSSPKGFDCSGFTSYVYKQFSIELNRDSRSQYNQGTPIKQIADLRAGDLVFWKGSSRSGGIGHVGIVTEVSQTTGSFKFVHAATHGGIRVSDSREAYYLARYVGARRILSEDEVVEKTTTK